MAAKIDRSEGIRTAASVCEYCAWFCLPWDQDNGRRHATNKRHVTLLLNSSRECASCRIVLGFLTEELGQNCIDYHVNSYGEGAGMYISATLFPTISEVCCRSAGHGYIHLTVDCSRSHCSGGSRCKITAFSVSFCDADESMSQEPIWSIGTSSTSDSVCIVGDWLSSCDKNHIDCRRPSTQLPTRVIDTGLNQDENPRLVINSDSCLLEGNYAALSHCWGGKPPLRTTKATLERRTQSLTMNTLPKTFREAILVCRHLGLRYLWIDSLCIIQDDADDWSREAARMASVYSNAYVTLGATASSNSSQGLFRDRPCPVQMDIDLSFGMCDPQNGRISYENERRTLRFLRDDPPNNLLSISPLFERGWTLQETLLSRRMVHFTSSQLVWQCFTCMTTETNLHETPRNHSFIPMDLNSTEGIYDAWITWAKEYNRRKLTFPRDKTAALAGLVAFIQSRRSDESLLGLWKGDLVRGLLWTKSGSGRQTKLKKIPTWSWMSLQTGVDWPFYDARILKCDPQIELIQHQIVWSGEPYSSMVVTGDLMFKGRILKWAVAEGLPVEDWDRTRFESQDDGFRTEAYPDTEDAKLVLDKYLVLVCIDQVESPIESVKLHCLVCSLVDSESNAYSRLGRAEIIPELNTPNLFEDVEPQDFILR